MSIINDALKKADKTIVSINQNHSRVLFGKGKKRTLGQKFHLIQTKRQKYRLLLLIAIMIVLFIYKLFLLKEYTNNHINMPPVIKEIPFTSSPLGASDITSNEPALKESIPQLSLNGIMQTKDKSWAIINNHVVQKGDTIEGAEVVEIFEKYVKLISHNKKLILRIE